MKKRKLTVGVYYPTDAFKALTEHSCVCFEDDMGLVAVTGPARDRESQEYADLFSAAPELLAALEGLIPLIENTFPKQQETWLSEARDAIDKAKGIIYEQNH